VLLARDTIRNGVGLREAVRTLFTVPALGVVVNGRVFTRGEWPTAREMTVLLDELV
jgi:hypothetical protein